MKIGGRTISADGAAYVIAEIGVNHNGSVDLAHRMIDDAKAAGADAVKFQTFLTDEVILPGTAQAAYQAQRMGGGDQAEMVRALELGFADFAALHRHCAEVGMDFISTAFDPASLDFVISLGPACLKWPSGEITNWPLLRQAAAARLPVLLSTGMANMHDIAGALDQLGAGAEVAILQCVSNYPARLEDQNLRTLPALAAAFGCPVGLSDHTLGPYAAVAARALGMAVLEKHFTLDKAMPGPDHAASSEPAEFAELVRVLRAVEAGLGDGIKRPLACEENVKAVARKSLVYRADLPAGHVLRAADLTAKRPASGLAPDGVDMVVGQQLARAVRRDEMLALAHFGSHQEER
jgi:N,N'-diacetyllegionaminate synthase